MGFVELPRRARDKLEAASAEGSDPGALADAALALIRARPGISCRELRTGLALSTAALERPLAALLAAGHVRREGEESSATYFPADRPPDAPARSD